ncbi:Calcium-binding protein NCS-1 [Sorochytrium milnesiophthora]
MGHKVSRLSSDQVHDLIKSTHFDRKELQHWYRTFMRDCPSGLLDKTEFARIYKQFFPFGDPTEFSAHVFDVFDTNANGYIDFREFIIALSITSRGKLEEKLLWAFRLYDVNKDGFISHDEMLSVVSAIYKMVGSMGKLGTDEDTPQKRVAKIFELMDKDHDGLLSMQEFKEGSKNDPSILQALNLYDSLA